jgi:hypothetical protein
MALPAAVAARPSKPSLTPRLALALRWSARWLYPENADPYPVPEPNWEPAPLDDAALDEARAQIAELKRYLAPVTDFVWLNRRVATWLKQLSWVPDLEEDALTMVLMDWVRLLQRFPKWAIDRASLAEIGDPQRLQGRRYQIADAVAACTRQVADAQAELSALERLVDPEEQERARRRRDEREAEERRAAERDAYVARRNAEDPDWSPIKDALRTLGTDGDPTELAQANDCRSAFRNAVSTGSERAMGFG